MYIYVYIYIYIYPNYDLSNYKNLVGGVPTPLKNISHMGLLFPIYMYLGKL